MIRHERAVQSDFHTGLRQLRPDHEGRVLWDAELGVLGAKHCDDSERGEPDPEPAPVCQRSAEPRVSALVLSLCAALLGAAMASCGSARTVSQLVLVAPYATRGRTTHSLNSFAFHASRSASDRHAIEGGIAFLTCA